ncbi:MAG: glycosyltransferase [Deltaproteobacteria bacterium]
MNILFLTSSLAPHFGGAAFSESALSSELSKKNQVTVLSRLNRVDPEFAKTQGIGRVEAFRPIEVLIAYFFSFHRLAKAVSKADIFHLNGHWYWENYFFARLCNKYRVPYVFHPRGMLWVGYRKPRIKKMFNVLLGNWIASHAAKVILLSEFEKEHCRPYPLKAENLVVVPNGIDSTDRSPTMSQSSQYFLYLGRIEPRKNLEFLIRAFKIFFDKNNSCALRLMGPVERKYDVRLRALIKKLSLENIVQFEEPKYGEEKNQVLRGAQAVIYPAFEEPFGRTVFEAFAAGTLCLVPEKSGGSEYVKKFVPEAIYESNSEVALAKKMEAILSLHQPIRSNWIQQSQNWISKNLNWKSISNDVLEIYQQVLV